MKDTKKSDLEIDSEESEVSIVPPTDVVTFNELRSVYELFRLAQDSLEIHPKYQRGEVWNDQARSRFIDSLAKSLPIPSMCISYDYKLEKRQVIDGQQRISTIVKFFKEANTWKLSNIEGVDEKLRGKTPSEIGKSHPEVYRRIENVTIPVTVIRCNFELESHLSYIYLIFRRLNESGSKLNNQEIRNAIYQGNFNDLLHRCDGYKPWEKLAGAVGKPNRMKRVELVLRFLSFYYNLDSYKGKLAGFLNDYMFKRRHDDSDDCQVDYDMFTRTVDALLKATEAKKKHKKESATIIETLMYGVAKNLGHVENMQADKLALKKNTLINKLSSSSDLLEGIMKKEKVVSRLNESKRIFSE